MNRIIYFADKAVEFTDREPDTPHILIRLEINERVSRAKILKFFESNNFIAVVSPDLDAAYEAFVLDFMPVEAAGGIVVNPQGEWLMIHRNGRWDLPKGHLEAFETLEQCAVREVGEETGVLNASIVRPLCDTMHAYNLYGKWELKCTHWYELRSGSVTSATPQIEEGIDRVVWCTPDQVRQNMRTTFPTIRHVAESMLCEQG